MRYYTYYTTNGFKVFFKILDLCKLPDMLIVAAWAVKQNLYISTKRS